MKHLQVRCLLASGITAVLSAASAAPCLSAPGDARIARIQYRVEKRWLNVPSGPLYVLQDTPVAFRVLPSGRRWRRMPHWSGLAGAAGRGTVRVIQFSRLARHRGDFQTLTVVAANRVRVPVLVYALEPIMVPVDNFPGRSLTSFGIGEDVKLSVKITPSVPVSKLGGLEWAVDRFPGDGSLIDFGERDGNGLLTVGADEDFMVNVRLLRGPSQGHIRGIWMRKSDDLGKAIIEPAEREYFADLEKINAACRTMKLAQLKRTANEIEAKWRSRNPERYLALVARVCDLLDSVDFGGNQRFALAQEFARRALPVARKSEPGAEVVCLMHLLRELEYNTGAARSAAWARLRREKVMRWLDAIQRTASRIDRKFDPSDMSNWPEMNMTPPVGPSGIAPEAIKDAKAFAAYETAISANNRKSEKMNQQVRQRQQLEKLWRFSEDYIVRAYAKPPMNSFELGALLSQHQVEFSRAQRILRRVAEKRKKEKYKGRFPIAFFLLH